MHKHVSTDESCALFHEQAVCLIIIIIKNKVLLAFGGGGAILALYFDAEVKQRLFHEQKKGAA